MGFRSPTYLLWLWLCYFIYATVGTLSISVLRRHKFFLERKNFQLEPDRRFFHMICLFFMTCSMLFSVFFHLVTLNMFVFVSVWTAEGSSEVEGIVSMNCILFWAEFTHFGSVEALFLEKILLFLSLNWSPDTYYH